MSLDKPSSVQPVLRSRLLPRISFQSLFALTTLSALIASLARVAGDGGALALAVMVAIAFPLSCFLLFAILFLFSWAITFLWYDQEEEDTLKGSPFAAGQLPPQIMPPRDPSL